MAFVSDTPRPYAVLRRGTKEMEMLNLYDRPQYSQSNGIYADVSAADITGLASLLDAKIQSYRLPDGTVKKDDDFVPMADTDVNDAVGKVLTVVFTNSKKASIYVPMILTLKIEDLVTKFLNFIWKDVDKTALVVDRIDYKTSMKKEAPAV